MSTEPDEVRAAIARWRAHFPDVASALRTDALAAAAFKTLERSLVQADIAMQNEGLPPEVRRRVVTAALYGSVDPDAAVARHETHQAAVLAASRETVSFRMPT